jgi:cytochrome c peroxidase
MKTGPWMHDGTQKDMPSILEIFNKAEKVGNMDNLLKPLGLTSSEKADLLAFLHAISSPPIDFQKPVLPE